VAASNEIVEKLPDKGIGTPCHYCGALIGSTIMFKGKKRSLRLIVDHFEPVASGGLSIRENLFYSCHLCNSIKNRSVFRSVEELRSFLRMRYEKGSWRLIAGPVGSTGTVAFNLHPAPLCA
jgi:hypothetical protein